MKAIIEFHLIKITDNEYLNNYVIDPHSFKMNGGMNYIDLNHFLWEDKTWHDDVWNDPNNEILDSCNKQIILEIWLDSDDNKSWLDYKVLNEYPDVFKSNITNAFKAGYEQRVCEQLQRALDGLGQNSAYNDEELDKSAKAWATKHYY